MVLESNWQPLTLQTLENASLELQLVFLQLNRSSSGGNLPSPKLLKRSILDFLLPLVPAAPSLLLSQVSCWLLGRPLCLVSAPPTHVYTHSRPPPLVPKMPLGLGQISSRSVFEDRPSIKCVWWWGWGRLVVCCLCQHLFTHSSTVWDAKELGEWISPAVCCVSYDSRSTGTNGDLLQSNKTLHSRHTLADSSPLFPLMLQVCFSQHRDKRDGWHVY